MAKPGHSAQNAALDCLVFETLRERTDRFHLLFPQSTQIILTEPIFVQESAQHILKSSFSFSTTLAIQSAKITSATTKVYGRVLAS
mgnify:CR=1 FL=1|jgi:hypothetical protein